MTPTSLLYATAGYSWAKIKANGYFDVVNDADPGDIVAGKTSVNLQGPFVGLGMETQLGRNWSLRGEARYTMFNDVITASGQFEDDTIFVDKLDANLLTARLTLTYKFNRDEPHVSPIK
jgi:opacity protein-like surface antigen